MTPQPNLKILMPPSLDYQLLFTSLLLITLGLLMVTSASMPSAQIQTGQPFYYLFRQAIYATCGLAIMGIVLRMPISYWQRGQSLLLVFAIGLLILVLVPGVGKEVNGSTRWINLGPINIQVSELAKLFALIYMAGYLQRHQLALPISTMAMIRPLAVMGVLALLLLLEPDFGTAVVILVVALGLLFLAGVSLWRFLALQGLLMAVMAVLIYSSDYRWRRLISFIVPWDDPFNSDYQLTQSLIAIGRGELLGVGLGASIQKLFYLPEAHTDFVLAILAEELGLVGILTVMGLFIWIVWRAFRIAAHAQRLDSLFAAYVAYGIGLWFAIQTLFSMGVNMGVLPTKGLTLPLMSYGGSSMVVMCTALGLLLRIDQETRTADPYYQRCQVSAPQPLVTTPTGSVKT